MSRLSETSLSKWYVGCCSCCYCYCCCCSCSCCCCCCSVINVYSFLQLPLLEPHGKLLFNNNLLQIYSLFTSVDYIINYENAQNTLRTVIRESRTFSQFLRGCLKDPELDCKDLHDFLIMPVQRIPRYPLAFVFVVLFMVVLLVAPVLDFGDWIFSL